MIFDTTSFLSTLLEEKNLAELKALQKPQQRVQNSSQSYSSVLMLSAHNIKHLNKIDELEADAIILNLEDGVAPEFKPYALELCAYFLTHIKESEKKLIVRVNSLDEGGLEEIKYLNDFYPDAIRVAKIKNAQEVQTVLDLLDKSIELHLSIETSEAWLNLKELAHPRVKAYYLGVLDLLADLNMSQDLLHVESEISTYILSHFLITSKALNIKPVSFVYQEYKNDKMFQRWLDKEKLLGFDAKGCISPTQVLQVNRSFNTNQYELVKAKEIVTLFEANSAKDIHGFTHEKYGFIDEPIYKNALNIVQKGR